MNDPVLKMTACEGSPGGERFNRLYQLVGDVNRARRVAGLSFPFGQAIVSLHDERDTLVVQWALAESAIQYGQFVVDAWRELGMARLEFILPDETRLAIDAAATAHNAVSSGTVASAVRGQRQISPKAFSS